MRLPQKNYSINYSIGKLLSLCSNYILFQCNPSEFGCSNGTCISIEKHCDGIADCNDKFDEINCEMVTIDKDLYHREQPPLNKETLHTSVNVDFEIISIDDFDEIQMAFTLKFKVELKWFVHSNFQKNS